MHLRHWTERNASHLLAFLKRYTCLRMCKSGKVFANLPTKIHPLAELSDDAFFIKCHFCHLRNFGHLGKKFEAIFIEALYDATRFDALCTARHVYCTAVLLCGAVQCSIASNWAPDAHTGQVRSPENGRQCNREHICQFVISSVSCLRGQVHGPNSGLTLAVAHFTLCPWPEN